MQEHEPFLSIFPVILAFEAVQTSTSVMSMNAWVVQDPGHSLRTSMTVADCGATERHVRINSDEEDASHVMSCQAVHPCIQALVQVLYNYDAIDNSGPLYT